MAGVAVEEIQAHATDVDYAVGTSSLLPRMSRTQLIRQMFDESGEIVVRQFTRIGACTPAESDQMGKPGRIRRKCATAIFSRKASAI